MEFLVIAVDVSDPSLRFGRVIDADCERSALMAAYLDLALTGVNEGGYYVESVTEVE